MAFVRFMSSTPGRLVRIVAGLAFIGAGLAIGGGGGTALAAIGVVPLAAGVGDVCLFAPLGHLPLSGRKVREQTSHP